MPGNDPMQVVAAAVTPVVLISASAILVSGVNSRYMSISDKMRSSPMNGAKQPLRLSGSAKGAAARRQGRKELAGPFGGAPDTATVLRVFLKKHSLPTR